MSAVIRNTFIYVVIGFLPVAANFLLAPVYTAFLQPDQYALIGIATLFQTFLTFFISFSLDGAYSRLYFGKDHSAARQHLLLSTLVISVTAAGAIVLAVLGVMGDRLFHSIFTDPRFTFRDFGYWIVLTTYANVVFLLLSMRYRNAESSRGYAWISLSFFFVPVAGSLAGLLTADGGPARVVAGRAIGSLAVITVYLLSYYKRQAVVFSWKWLRSALQYALPLIPYQLMFAGFMNIDRIILERKFSSHDFGVYNFAVMVSGLIPVFINAFSNAINPRIYKELTLNEDPAVVRSYSRMLLLATTVVVCVSVATVVPGMRLFISSAYRDAYVYAACLVLSYLPYVHYQIFSLPFSFHGKTVVFPIVSFLALVAGIVFNWIFLPSLGIWSVCFSLYVIRITQMGAAYIFVRSYRYSNGYLQQQGPVFLSLLVIVAYLALLQLNQYWQLVPVDVINLFPLLTMIVLAPKVYREEIPVLFSIGSRMRNNLAIRPSKFR